jgi:hypothetical protein
MDEPQEYGLIVSFEDQSPSYVHGFEAGIIDARMKSGAEAEIEVVVHTENRETLRRMAVAYGWSVEFVDTEVEGWTTANFAKTRKPIDRPNPTGLRVVN